MTGRTLIGRAEERSLLGGHLEANRSVMLSGAAGVGKTYLAREVLADLADAGRRVDWITATRSSRQIPFAALGPILPPDVDLAAGWPSAVEVLRALQRAYQPLDADARAVIGVDDAHLLDAGSATLVLQLVASGSVTMALTVTSGEPPPDAVTRIWKDGLAERLELQPLSRDETGDLAATLLGAPCSQLALEVLWDTTLGNPLYLRELVGAARADGSLVERSGRWQLGGDLRVNHRLVELISARIEELDEVGHAALEHRQRLRFRNRGEGRLLGQRHHGEHRHVGRRRDAQARRVTLGRCHCRRARREGHEPRRWGRDVRGVFHRASAAEHRVPEPGVEAGGPVANLRGCRSLPSRPLS